MSSRSNLNAADAPTPPELRSEVLQGPRPWAARIAALVFVLGLLFWWLPSAVLGPLQFLHYLFPVGGLAWWAPAVVLGLQAAPLLVVAALADPGSRPRKAMLILAAWVLANAAWQAWQAFPG